MFIGFDLRCACACAHHARVPADERSTPLTAEQVLSAPLTLTVRQAAELCGVSDDTMRRWIGEGIPVLPFTGETRIGRDALCAFLRGDAA